MTIKQKQCLLEYLGYYNPENSKSVNNVDGIWGPASRAATEKFQCDYGLPQDKDCGEQTQKALTHAVAYGMPKKKIEWSDIKYFERSEFKCKCGGKYCNGYPAEIDMEMVKIADVIRERLGKPIRVNSGVRCETHNANVGGEKASQHLYGKASDLRAPSGVTPAQMAEIAEELLPNSGGIGIYSWGIHIDTREKKSRWNG